MTPMIGQGNLRDPEGIALDLWNERIFWTDSGNKSLVDGKVYRCKLDGSAVEVPDVAFSQYPRLRRSE